MSSTISDPEQIRSAFHTENRLFYIDRVYLGTRQNQESSVQVSQELRNLEKNFRTSLLNCNRLEQFSGGYMRVSCLFPLAGEESRRTPESSVCVSTASGTQNRTCSVVNRASSTLAELTELAAR